MDSDQNYNLDIDQMFKDWIAPIDALRSYAAPNLGAEFNKLGSGTDKTDITDYVKKIKIETTPQESRCHAFYRLIGLPVVSNDNTIYSPGFDIFRCKGKKISKLDKLNIARNPIEGFNKLSFEREECLFKTHPFSVR